MIMEVDMTPLRKGTIPVITPIGFMSDDQRIVVSVDADEIVLALTREFAGLYAAPVHNEDPHDTAARVKTLQREVSLDHIITIGPSGGIPSIERSQSSHISINLEQEFKSIRKELLQSKMCPSSDNVRLRQGW